MDSGAAREVWIGLVEVAADDGNEIFEGAPGAYTNVLALANSLDDYMALTAAALKRDRLVAIGVDDPEPLRERQSRIHVSDEMLQLGEQASRGEVMWGTFHVFEEEDEE
jgi:hypothetical protein